MQFAQYLYYWIFQLGQNTRSVQNWIQQRRRRKRKAGMGECLSSALEHRSRGPDGRTATTSYGCSRKHVTSSGASVHHISIFGVGPECLTDSSQVDAQCLSDGWLDCSSYSENQTCDLPVRSWQPHYEDTLPLEKCSLITAACLVPEWSREKRKRVGARRSIFVYFCISLVGAR